MYTNKECGALNQEKKKTNMATQPEKQVGVFRNGVWKKYIFSIIYIAYDF